MNLEDFPEVPAHVRMIIWLGLEKHQEDWTNREQTEGDFCVYAETVSLLLTYSLVLGDHVLFGWTTILITVQCLKRLFPSLHMAEVVPSPTLLLELCVIICTDCARSSVN